MADTFNYRIDHHGSLVRPAGLATDDPEALDAAVRDAVAHQRKLRSTVVTDGDYPREDFRGAVLGNVSGLRRTAQRTADGLTRWVAESLPKANGPLAADWAARLAGLTVIAPKVSLPSPAYLAATTFEPGHGPGSARELGDAFAEIVHAEIELLVSKGVRLIQLNNPLLLDWPDDSALSYDDALTVETLAVRLDERPEGVRVGVCPGWAAPAAVDRARLERLYAQVPADRWVLPYDQGTDAELDLVRALPEDRDVCLGVVDATVPALEDVDTVMARIDAAAELKDIEDMAVSPSRGFADVAARPLLTAEDQRRKLVLVETVARYCWGNEF
ncbi:MULTISPECIES: methionine synthase II (cobalamin-independent)-like protein [unclassified Streptomyces]|uniref:methionine synthase II (cobalamin-independent)-like protein n=1 Tax=unclassified Streptomyces TaxID=2593676 RepID=UPI00093C63C1|nr:methionine synthase II (cobalamin-independent)-like protein [Streptomyces sp. TSRI0107]OKJ73573.1 methionine synthase II (cobalamin-independent)-like protein [Streptomyces sp. TSRI0107]